MDLLGKKLKQQKELREKAAKKPRKKQEYTPVEIDTGLDDERGGFENDPEPEPGEETTIRMRPKSKPLPLPPSAKPKSPRISPGAKQQNSVKLPSDSASKNQFSGDSGRKSSQSQAKTNSGMALLQELSKKKGLKPTASKAAGGHDASPSTRRMKDNKPLLSVPNTSKAVLSASFPGTADQQADEESEPVYANTANTLTPSGTAYQNCDFSRPPGATPTSSAGATPTSTSGVMEEYQNINFGVQKQSAPQTKKKPKGAGGARSPNVAGKNHSHTHASPGGPQVNGSVAGNSAGEYQNFQFGQKK